MELQFEGEVGLRHCGPVHCVRCAQVQAHADRAAGSLLELLKQQVVCYSGRWRRHVVREGVCKEVLLLLAIKTGQRHEVARLLSAAQELNSEPWGDVVLSPRLGQRQSQEALRLF